MAESVIECPNCGTIFFSRACVINTDGYYHPYGSTTYICQNCKKVIDLDEE